MPLQFTTIKRSRYKPRENGPLSTQTKSFWVLFTILSIGAVWLPLGWGIVETVVALVVSWWIIYRTDLF